CAHSSLQLTKKERIGEEVGMANADAPQPQPHSQTQGRHLGIVPLYPLLLTHWELVPSTGDRAQVTSRESYPSLGNRTHRHKQGTCPLYPQHNMPPSSALAKASFPPPRFWSVLSRSALVHTRLVSTGMLYVPPRALTPHRGPSA